MLEFLHHKLRVVAHFTRGKASQSHSVSRQQLGVVKPEWVNNVQLPMAFGDESCMNVACRGQGCWHFTACTVRNRSSGGLLHFAQNASCLDFP